MPMRIRQRMYALVNEDGTAMAETALCSVCYPEQGKQELAALAASEPGEWEDCTENDALTCRHCGGRS